MNHKLLSLRELNLAEHSPAAIKSFLVQEQEHLKAAFYELESPAAVIIQRYSQTMDNLLVSIWQQFMGQNNCALIAVGGYGREELFPYSDIDLLILVEEWDDGRGQQLTEFIQLLWDIGLKIGYSCRSLDECIEQAADDLTIITNLMESRFLTGSPELHDQLIYAINKDDFWPAETFFYAKLKEQQERHSKHNFTEYNLEPDIKSAPGGLRDINTLLWMANRYYKVSALQDLIPRGFITTAEQIQLKQCQNFLFSLRFALHMLTEKDENRLLFNFQKSMAELLRYEGNEGNMAVEKMMQDYYQNALATSHLNELLIQFLEQDILGKHQQLETIEVNERFHLCNGFLGANNPEIFSEAPETLLEIFVIYGQTKDIKGIQASSIRKIMANAHLIDEQYRQEPKHNALFMSLFTSAKHHLSTPLRLMHRYGVLPNYMPEFQHISGMMQYDLFHIYTVDIHTLKVVENMRRLRYESTANKYPLAVDVFHQLPKKELLYLSGIFHDIAKGRGGDHSELGAEDAQSFGKLHDLGQWDTNLITWLTESHLLMSMTAQSKDIYDPEVIHEFAKAVGDITRLNYLYCLTVCDISATNPKLWNGWRAELLSSLYKKAKRQLLHGLSNPLSISEQINYKQQTALTKLKELDNDPEAITQHWDTLGNEYFLRETWQDIVWHTHALLNHEGDLPVILLQEPSDVESDHSLQIFIYTEDNNSVFSNMVKTLDKLELSVLDARIITSNAGFSLDTYIVQSTNPDFPELMPSASEIIDTLKLVLIKPETVAQLEQKKRIPRQYKYFDSKNYINITNTVNDDYSMVEIRTIDYPGLLSQIATVFNEFDLNILGARISTLGERVEDYFFVTDANNLPLKDEELCKKIIHAIDQNLKDWQKQ